MFYHSHWLLDTWVGYHVSLPHPPDCKSSTASYLACAAEEVLERDFFMSASEALEFGLVDEVIKERPKTAAELEF